MSKIPALATVTPDFGRAPALHPLLAAVVATLPAPGMPWTVEQRVDWLRMADMAARVAYGPCGEIAIVCDEIDFAFDRRDPGGVTRPAAPAPAEPPKPKALEPHSAYAFYVRDDGVVRRTISGAGVVPDECQGEEIYDYRPAVDGGRDYSSLIWADGTTGAQGDLTLCGPGR